MSVDIVDTLRKPRPVNCIYYRSGVNSIHWIGALIFAPDFSDKTQIRAHMVAARIGTSGKMQTKISQKIKMCRSGFEFFYRRHQGSARKAYAQLTSTRACAGYRVSDERSFAPEVCYLLYCNKNIAQKAMRNIPDRNVLVAREPDCIFAEICKHVGQQHRLIGR